MMNAHAETQRTALMADLVEARARAEAHAEKRARLEAEIRAKQMQLARHLETLGPTVEQLEGGIVKLADPAISQAIAETTNLANKTRAAFRTTPVLKRSLAGTQARQVSNALEIADVLARIQAARQELEALLMAPRPGDLDARITALLDPLRAAVGRLHGI